MACRLGSAKTVSVECQPQLRRNDLFIQTGPYLGKHRGLMGIESNYDRFDADRVARDFNTTEGLLNRVGFSRWRQPPGTATREKYHQGRCAKQTSDASSDRLPYRFPPHVRFTALEEPWAPRASPGSPFAARLRRELSLG